MCSEKRCFLVFIIFSLLGFLALIIVAGVYFEDFDQENFTVWIQAKALRIEISAAALLENDEIGKYLTQLSLSLQYLLLLPALSGLIIFAFIYPASRPESSLSFIFFMVLTIVIASLFALLFAIGSIVRIIGAVGNEQLNSYFEDSLIENLEPFIREIGSNPDADDIFNDVALELDIRALGVEFFDFSGGEMVNFHNKDELILPGPDIGEFMEFAIKVDSTFGRLRLNKIDFLEFLIRDEINWVGQIIRNSFVLDWTILVMVVYCSLCITTILTSVSVLKKRKSQQGKIDVENEIMLEDY
ncbi:unnamed protein product [Oikopleura dioica]|uniref:Uncharacterized protein n=1 Tax=Oikopleura dioica TaxID=34765 RepID=E4YFM7_OIKDI|nr:unnamed protein product [Oikopleura dioica]